MDNKPNNSYESALRQASGKKSLYKLSKTYPAYLLLALMIGISFLVMKFAADKKNVDNRAEFDKAVSGVMTRVDNQLQRHLQVLSSMQGLYDQNIEVVRDYFELYGAVPAKTYTSIMSLAYVPQVKAADFDNYFFNARSQGYYDYRLDPPGKRDEYYPVLHIVRFDKNTNRLGFDYATVPFIKDAIVKSKETNKYTATQVFDLRKDTAGFCLVAPIYIKESPRSNIHERNENFQAALVLEVNVNEFFSSALLRKSEDIDKDKNEDTDKNIVFSFADAKTDVSFFNSSNTDNIKFDSKPEVEETILYNIADKQIKCRFEAVPGFGGAFRQTLPYVGFGVALALSFAFFAFVLSVITNKARAEEIAERITRSQRRIVDSSKDIISVMDFTGIFKSMNFAGYEILGVPAETLVGSSISDYISDNSHTAAFRKFVENAKEEQTERMDMTVKTADGQIKWINWSFTVSKADNLIYAIGRDVTLEKAAEEQAKLKSRQIMLAEHYAREASESKTFFMIKMSHQLRNSLTGILGYLQLLSQKLYDTQEEHDSYIEYAEQSSEEIFTFVSDIIDTALTDQESSMSKFVNVNIEKAAMNAAELESENKKIRINYNPDGKGAHAVVDKKLLTETFALLFSALSGSSDNCSIQINAEENTFEGATEIQLLAEGNLQVEKLIGIYKENSNNLVESLKIDSDEILLNLGRAASNIRRLNGSMSVETFGGDEGNLVLITLPLIKKYTE